MIHKGLLYYNKLQHNLRHRIDCYKSNVYIRSLSRYAKDIPLKDMMINKKDYLTVSIVGRPNTGKSTIFNRLTQTKMAIVSNIPGTTRDRREGKGFIGGLPLNIIDTGGLDDRGAVSKTIQIQVEKSFKDSDVVLFVLDGRAGVTALDEHFAQWLRKTVKPNTRGSKEQSAAAIDILTTKNIGEEGCDSIDIQQQQQQPTQRSIILVANKTEGAHMSNLVMNTVADALGLGFGEPILISATHGDGMADLAQALIAEAEKRGKKQIETRKRSIKTISNTSSMNDTAISEVSTTTSDATDNDSKPYHKGNVIAIEDRIIQLAIMGRPNVGKSTLLNAFIQEERSITGPMPGLTRDAVTAEWQHRDRVFRLVDTAGLTRIRTNRNLLEIMQVKEKRLSVLSDKIGLVGTNEKVDTSSVKLPGLDFVNPEHDPSQYSYQISEYALVSAMNALRYAQVVLLVVEGSQGTFSKLDLQLANKCLEEGRGLVIAANKGDILTANGISSNAYEEGVRAHIANKMREFGEVPVVVSSGTELKGINKILDTVIEVHDAWSKRITTGNLNKWLQDLLVTNPPPRVDGKLLNLKFIAQVKTRPPTFALFTNMKEIPIFFERFLKSNILQAFKLQGIPIRFVIRKTAALINKKPTNRTTMTRKRLNPNKLSIFSGKKGLVGPNRHKIKQQRKVANILKHKRKSHNIKGMTPASMMQMKTSTIRNNNYSKRKSKNNDKKKDISNSNSNNSNKTQSTRSGRFKSSSTLSSTTSTVNRKKSNKRANSSSSRFGGKLRKKQNN